MKYSHIFLTLFFGMLVFFGPGGVSAQASPEEPDVSEEKAAEFSGGAVVGGRYMETGWEKLIPPGWNPAKVFEGLNLDKLSDNDPRAVKAMEKFKKMWDDAPVHPELNGKLLKISGFAAPLEFTDKAELKDFLLVPYFGACIHAPPPPANQIIFVTLEKARKGLRVMDAVTVYGKIIVEKTETDMGRSGYRMKADFVEPYVERNKQ